MKLFLAPGVLVALLVSSTLGHKVIDCTSNAVTIQWRPELNSDQKLDPSKAHLGTCPPSSIFLDENVLLFSVWLHDCGFKEVVSEDRVIYTNMLIYNLGVNLPLITDPVECVYNRYRSSAGVNNVKRDFVFTLELVDGDFNGPAPFNMFTFGTRIPILAKVEQQDLLAPVQIYLQSCVLANTTDLTRASQLHTLISDAGCLKEGKEGNAMYLPRRDPSEICFYFQAFKFAAGQQVFLHCDMATLELQSFSVSKKACQYLQRQNRWELLDDPSQSDLCSCCDFTCIDGTNSDSGIYTRQVLGPFSMVDSQSSTPDESFWPDEQELRGGPVWVIALAVCLVLILMAGAGATSYYLCFWRGGRMGYRPSRELLNKH